MHKKDVGAHILANVFTKKHCLVYIPHFTLLCAIYYCAMLKSATARRESKPVAARVSCLDIQLLLKTEINLYNVDGNSVHFFIFLPGITENSLWRRLYSKG